MRSAAVAPVWAGVSSVQGVLGREGRSPVASQIGPATSWLRREAPFLASVSMYSLAMVAGTQLPSSSRVSPSPKWLSRYSATVGTPAEPACIHSISLPASCLSACT